MCSTFFPLRLYSLTHGLYDGATRNHVTHSLQQQQQETTYFRPDPSLLLSFSQRMSKCECFFYFQPIERNYRFILTFFKLFHVIRHTYLLVGCRGAYVLYIRTPLCHPYVRIASVVRRYKRF